MSEPQSLPSPSPALPMVALALQPLDPAAFAPFGAVISIDGQPSALEGRPINAGNALRYDLLPTLDMQRDGGQPMLALFRAQARHFPLHILEMERHRLGSQAFIPLGTQRFAVVVARAGAVPEARQLQGFLSNGFQGIVLAPGVWHHALLAVDGGDFAVLERRAAVVDCDVHPMAQGVSVSLGALPRRC